MRAGGGFSAAINKDSESITTIDLDAKAFNAGGIIVDLGTTDTHLKKSVKLAFVATWKAMTGTDMPVGGKVVRLTLDELNALPTILFQLRVVSHLTGEDAQAQPKEVLPGMAAHIDPAHPNDVLVAMPASHYLTSVSDKGDWKLRLHFSESDNSGGVLGANEMLGHDVAFDLDTGRIGWAESDCNYEGLSGNEVDTTR
jgi:hypothetical protein